MTHAARAARRAGIHALHHLTLLTGILAFPFVLLTRNAGVSLPVGAVVSRIHDTYDRVVDATDK
ncbi:hypothetical protein ACFQFH_08605 [Halobaculum halobium]|uniref:4-hydroxybenzoate polyprenyltransferase n=1 Tax=Halobaculum halobium TaxID=3032281 RepID=A0ABD5TEL8_9EURY|nr:hypothetical protein [Halobaculum sp. SYNS20]